MSKQITGTRREARNSSDIYQELRTLILDGKLPPGEKIKTAVTAKEFGVSLGVVREALTRLAERGLAVAEPNRGFHVRPISKDDLNDLIYLRTEVETLAVGRSIEFGDEQWEANAIAAHHMLSRMYETGGQSSNPELRRYHERFHDSLAAACDSPRLKSLRRSLSEASALYQSQAYLRGSGPVRAAADHEKLLEAVLLRDKDKALELVTTHLESTLNILKQQFVGD
jgi:GntR family carbon starvation induced transcriptional regulator